MLEIMKKEYRRHKAFIMAYIAICVFGAFFFGQFMYEMKWFSVIPLRNLPEIIRVLSEYPVNPLRAFCS